MLNANSIQGLLIPCHVCECGLVEGCELHNLGVWSDLMYNSLPLVPREAGIIFVQ